jgi:hypothetical protein
MLDTLEDDDLYAHAAGSRLFARTVPANKTLRFAFFFLLYFEPPIRLLHEILGFRANF